MWHNGEIQGGRLPPNSTLVLHWTRWAYTGKRIHPSKDYKHQQLIAISHNQVRMANLNDQLTDVAREFESIIRDGVADCGNEFAQGIKMDRLKATLQALVGGIRTAKWASTDAGIHPNEDIYHSIVNVAMLMVGNCRKMGSELTIPTKAGGEDAGEEDDEEGGGKASDGKRQGRGKKKKSKGRAGLTLTLTTRRRRRRWAGRRLTSLP